MWTLLLTLSILAADNDLIGRSQPPKTSVRQPASATDNSLLGAESSSLTYAQAHAEALRTGKPLIVWVGGDFCARCVAEDGGKEFVHHLTPKWEGVQAPATIIYMPEEGQLLQAATVTRWTVGSHDWGHLPSARRVAREWRAQVRTGNKAPLLLLNLGDGGNWGMSQVVYSSSYRGSYGSSKGYSSYPPRMGSGLWDRQVITPMRSGRGSGRGG